MHFPLPLHFDTAVFDVRTFTLFSSLEYSNTNRTWWIIRGFQRMDRGPDTTLNTTYSGFIGQYCTIGCYFMDIRDRLTKHT